jgi:hypothetical protein
MSADLYRYPHAVTPGPDGARRHVGADGWTEIAVLDGWIYVAGEGEPPVVDGLTPESAVLAPEIVAASSRHQFLLGQLAAHRYAVETGGIVWNGWPVATDRESRANLIAAYQAAIQGLRAEAAAWKFADGRSRLLTNEQVRSMALAVLAHVQSCFDREAELAEVIRSSLIPDEAVIQTGWPGEAAP